MLYRPICNIIRRTVFPNRKMHYGIQDTLIVNFKRYNLCTNYLYSQNLSLSTPKRFKSGGESAKYSKRYKEEEDDDDDDDDDNDDDEGLLVEDNYLCTSKSKIIRTTIPSLRLDAIAKAGLAMSRAKFDEEFYKSNIRVNGKKCSKKSIMVKAGDEIDHVLKQSPDNVKFIIVNRCKIASVSVESDTLKAKLIQDKSLLIENYDDPWAGVR